MVNNKLATIKIEARVYDRLKKYRLREQGRIAEGLTISQSVDLLLSMEAEVRHVVRKKSLKTGILPTALLTAKVIDGVIDKTKKGKVVSDKKKTTKKA